MDKALGVTGQHMSPRMKVALTRVITEEVTAQANASRTVESHLRNCKCFPMEIVSKWSVNLCSHITYSQLPLTPFLVKIKWQHSCIVWGDWRGSNTNNFRHKTDRKFMLPCDRVSPSTRRYVELRSKNCEHIGASTITWMSIARSGHFFNQIC